MIDYLQALEIDRWQLRERASRAVPISLHGALTPFAPAKLAGIGCENPAVLVIALASAVEELAPLNLQQHAGADAFAEPVGSLSAKIFAACGWDDLVLLNHLPDFPALFDIWQPKLILLLGLQAARILQPSCQNIKALRQKTHRLYQLPTQVSYHPQAALLDARFKKPLWQDLRLAQQFLASC